MVVLTKFEVKESGKLYNLYIIFFIKIRFYSKKKTKKIWTYIGLFSFSVTSFILFLVFYILVKLQI